MAPMMQSALGLLLMAGCGAQEHHALGRRLALTSAQKTAIVDKHNALRAGVSSPCTATDMETMVWDDTLASASQTHAAACVGDHDPRAAIDFGENLWMSFGSGGATYSTSDITTGIQEWYDEIADVDWITDSNGEYIEAKSKVYANSAAGVCKSPDASSGNCFIGHFTQVVWAKSNKVGCGISTCSPLTQSSQNMGAGVLLVCRYLTPGNSAAAQNSPNHMKMPYIAGTACAGCAGSCTTAGLCNAATTPTRCFDKVPVTANGITHATCAAYVTAIKAQFAGAGVTITDPCTHASTQAMFTGLCDLTCGTCTVPSGVGKNFCAGGSASGNTSATASSSAATSSTGPGVGTAGASHLCTIAPAALLMAIVVHQLS